MPGGVVIAPNGQQKRYPGKMTSYVFWACIVASSGGLIFGYDIGISGGVTSMDSFLKDFFPSVYHKVREVHETSQYCKFDSVTLTTFMSSLYLAALIASFFASLVTKKFGRKISMLFGGAVSLTGAALNAAAVNLLMLIFGRILIGIGVGFVNQAEYILDLQKQLSLLGNSITTNGHAEDESITSTNPVDKVRSQLDDAIASECPFCGDLMIREISLPFILPGESELASSWEIKQQLGNQRSLPVAI